MGESLRAELRQIHENTAIKVTLIEPGMTDTPFFDNRPGDAALGDTDVAKAVMFALEQGPEVDVNEILYEPPRPDPFHRSALTGHIEKARFLAEVDQW